MRIENFFMNFHRAGYGGLMFACGSFGVIDGAEFACESAGGVTVYTHRTEQVCLRAAFTETENGVVLRRDTLENLTDAPLTVRNLRSRFCLDGDAYEVYTQYNGWQTESLGAWLPLHTAVTAAASGMRSCDSAAPVMALYNRYSEKSTVFHLLPNARWQMTARKFSHGIKQLVVVETGFCDDGLSLTAEAGETVELPPVLFYGADSKRDLDAWKLHAFYNRRYPRKALPVQYNSWLYCFDNLDVDDLMRQADCAAELGFEAFMVDAGWFGKGQAWHKAVGDWEENTLSGPKGRLLELSDRVREKGMIFGLWFEPERADPESQAIKEHPEYFFGGKFFDFANPAAVDGMLEVICKRIEQYHIGWLKLDFNSTLPVDPTGDGYYRYYQGQKRFIRTLRERYPDLYITGCASGGYRMELAQGELFDSLWLSDHQGPCEGVRIVSDTLKRMPPALIERWNVQKYCEGLPAYGQSGHVGRMLSCNDATWEAIIRVEDSFTEGFLFGGPMGFSMDLCALPEHYKSYWKETIARYKDERDFFRTATARILADGNAVTALEYSDETLERICIQLFTGVTCARDLILYPAVDPKATYLVGGRTLTGADIKENGLRFTEFQSNACQTVWLQAAKKDVSPQ